MVNNKVILMGRLTKDAQIMKPKEGLGKIAHFSLAVDKLRRKKEEAEDSRESEGSSAYFFWCTAFDRQAVFLERFGKKGMKFALEGHLSTGGYEKDGVHITTVEIIVENIQFCERKGRDGNEQNEEQFLEISEEMLAEMPFE